MKKTKEDNNFDTEYLFKYVICGGGGGGVVFSVCVVCFSVCAHRDVKDDILLSVVLVNGL